MWPKRLLLSAPPNYYPLHGEMLPLDFLLSYTRCVCVGVCVRRLCARGTRGDREYTEASQLDDVMFFFFLRRVADGSVRVRGRSAERERRKSEKFGRAEGGGRGAWMRDWLQVVEWKRVRRAAIRNVPPSFGDQQKVKILAFPRAGCSL